MKLKSLLTLAAAMVASAFTTQATVLWTGSQDMGTAWGSNDNIQIAAASFANATVDTQFTVKFTENAGPEYFQIQLSEGAGWTKLAIAGANQYGSIDLASGATSFSFQLSAADLTKVKAGGLAIQGYGITVTEVSDGAGSSSSTDSPAAGSTTLWTGSQDMGTAWGSNDNIQLAAALFGAATVDTEFTVKYTENAGPEYFQLQVSEGAGWTKLAIAGANQYGSIDLASGSTSFTFKLSADDLAKVKAGGMALQGYGITVTEVSMTTAGGSSTPGTPSTSANVIWSGSQDMGTAWGSNDNIQLAAALFANATVDTEYTVKYTENAGPEYFQLQVSEGAGWTKLAIAGANQYGSIDLASGSTSFTFKLSADDLAKVKAGGMALQGYGITVTEVSMTTAGGSSTPDTPSTSANVIWSGSQDMGTAWGSTDNIKIDASYFANATVDTEFTVKFTENAGPEYFQLQVSEGAGWTKLAIAGANQYGSIDLASGATSFSFKLSADDLAKVKAGGMALQGYGITVTEVSMTTSGGSSTPDTPSTGAVVLFEGSLDMGTGWSVYTEIPAAKFATATTSTPLTFEYTLDAASSYWQLQLQSSWKSLEVNTNHAQTSGYSSLDMLANSTSFTCTLTAADLAAVKAAGMEIKGYALTLTKVTLGGTESGIQNVNAAMDLNAPVEYYDLQGCRVLEPANGLFIRRQGSKVTKVIL